MPLDTGSLQGFRQSPGSDQVRLWTNRRLELNPAVGIGAALRQFREARGLSLQDIADTTRIRPAYISAIEALDVASLPSRPYSIGYVRAYADAVGLETEAVAKRFRAEAPEAPEPQLPWAIPRERPRPSRLSLAIVGVVILAVIGWNLSRHGLARSERQLLTPSSRLVAAQVKPAAGPLRLGAPLPAPPEAATPPVYQTPGLAAAIPGSAAAGAVEKTSLVVAPAPLQPSDAGPIGARFVAAGPIYAIQGPTSDIILQARAATSLVVRGGSGAVYFARQLAPGEAWRAPAVDGLVADVDSPGAVEVFVGGVSRGVLTATKTPLARLSD